MSKIENLEKLFVEQLQDAYDFEHQLVEALPKMEKKATSPMLKRAFAEHLAETERQTKKLERVFEGMGEDPERKTCKGMKGLVAEGREILEASGDDAAIDAGLIAAAQKVEHYEMATYGTLRTFAQQLGRQQEARLLQEILDEESAANEKLTALATSGINQRAEDGDDAGDRKASGLDGMLRTLGLGGRGGQQQGSSGGSQARRGGSSSGTSRTASSRGGASKGGAKSASSSRGSSARSSNGTGKSASASRSAGSKSSGGRSSASNSNNTASSRKSSTSGRSASATARHTTRGSNGVGNSERTKEELMAEARKLGIEGRSGMTKAQLQRELQKRH